MFDYLDKLRQKPERTKKQVAFFVASFIVGVIFVVWFSIIYPQITVSKHQTAKVPENTEPSPASAFSQTFFAGLSAISEQVSKIQETVSSFSTLPTYYSATTTINDQ